VKSCRPQLPWLKHSRSYSYSFFFLFPKEEDNNTGLGYAISMDTIPFFPPRFENTGRASCRGTPKNEPNSTTHTPAKQRIYTFPRTNETSIASEPDAHFHSALAAYLRRHFATISKAPPLFCSVLFRLIPFSSRRILHPLATAATRRLRYAIPHLSPIPPLGSFPAGHL
jgi:hypothetical protein